MVTSGYGVLHPFKDFVKDATEKLVYTEREGSISTELVGNLCKSTLCLVCTSHHRINSIKTTVLFSVQIACHHAQSFKKAHRSVYTLFHNTKILKLI